MERAWAMAAGITTAFCRWHALCRAALLELVLPRECHDVRADFVLTEDALYACKGGG